MACSHAFWTGLPARMYCTTRNDRHDRMMSSPSPAVGQRAESVGARPYGKIQVRTRAPQCVLSRQSCDATRFATRGAIRRCVFYCDDIWMCRKCFAGNIPVATAAPCALLAYSPQPTRGESPTLWFLDVTCYFFPPLALRYARQCRAGQIHIGKTYRPG
jgi:hypothetical protein